MGVELPRMSKCCFCLPLKTGILIVGYISILASCATLSMTSWSIYRVSVYVENSRLKPDPEHPPSDVAHTSITLYVSLSYYLLVFLFNLIISIILVIGVHTDRSKYVRFYFQGTVVLFVLSVGLVILTCVFMGILVMLPVLKWSVTLLACIVMSRSYYLLLEENQNKPAFELQPYVPVHQSVPETV